MQLLHSAILSKYSEISHFITSKPYFFRCPFYEGDDKKVVLQNRQLLAQELRIKNQELVFLNQTHSTDIIVVDNTNYTEELYADAVISNTPGIYFCVLASDCVPLLFYDKKNQVVGVVHAGWKGLVGEIILKTLEQMQMRFKSLPEDIICYIGPCISQKNYEIGEDVRNEIPEIYRRYIDTSQNEGKYFLDIRAIAKRQLGDYGVTENQIEVSRYCTYRHKDLFYSYRRKTHFPQEKYGNNTFGISLKKLTQN